MSENIEYLMVLNDGTTYSLLEGCRIVAIPAVMTDTEVEAMLSEGTGLTVQEFGLWPEGGKQ